jgi:hypothetical protein
MSETINNDARIQMLADEVTRLRQGRHSADNHLQSVMLKVTEIQLNLATQDKTLAKLECAVQGGDRPGLLARVDRFERLAANLTRAVWLLTAAGVSAVVKIVFDHLPK